ncbi:lectin [Luteimonas pelagia]
MRHLLTPGWLLLACCVAAGCTRGAGGPGADGAGAGSGAPDPGAVALDQPPGDVPPATAPAGTTIPPQGLPAEGTIGFAGFGPAAFGAPAESVRQAWGGELHAMPDAEAACHYLSPPVEQDSGYQVAFMVEDGRFVRVDVATPRVTAPGGGRIGLDAHAIEAMYPGRVETRPHKYVDGASYLRIGDPDDGPGVLLFETDEDGMVTEWRIGIPPQVDYVEGCS